MSKSNKPNKPIDFVTPFQKGIILNKKEIISKHWPSSIVEALCDTHGLVLAKLCRHTYKTQSFDVPNVLVYACSKCYATLDTPQISAGRIAAGIAAAKETADLIEFRLPIEAEDLAYFVHTSLGQTPKHDVFSLPIMLGLKLAEVFDIPPAGYDFLNFFTKTSFVYVKPALTPSTYKRMEILKDRWKLESFSSVVNILIVFAWQKTS